MSDGAVIVVTAGLAATACALLGPFLVLRRMALLSDAVSHAVLPGIVGVWLVAQTRAPLAVVVGAAVFAVLCVLAIDSLQSTGLLGPDAAVALVFPALFSLGVLGVTRFADGIHLDLDSTIYGEIAFVPFDVVTLAGVPLARAAVVLGVVVALDAALVVLLWKELTATSFDPTFCATTGLRPRLLSRLLLGAVAVTAVAAFEAVGAILVITLLIVPAATALLLTERLGVAVALSVGVGWVGAVVGYRTAVLADATIAGSVGLVCTACFVLALVAAPGRGLLSRFRRRSSAPPSPVEKGVS